MKFNFPIVIDEQEKQRNWSHARYSMNVNYHKIKDSYCFVDEKFKKKKKYEW